MNCPDVHTAAVTINWVTDVIVPLASALIGGLLALLGVYITLKRDKIERQLEKEESARPFFTILEDGDKRINSDTSCFFVFFSYESDDILQGSLNMINSDKVEFIIDKITVDGRDLLPFRKELISKGMSFMILLYDYIPLNHSNLLLHVTDINYKKRIYKLILEDDSIKEFIEIQKEV